MYNTLKALESLLNLVFAMGYNQIVVRIKDAPNHVCLSVWRGRAEWMLRIGQIKDQSWYVYYIDNGGIVILFEGYVFADALCVFFKKLHEIAD